MFKNVHPSATPGPFWPKRVADRTPITTDSCVFRRGLKSGPREPKGRKSAPAGFLKALPRIGPKTELHQTLCFTMRNCFRTKNWGPYFSKNVAPLQRQGPFENLGELGTGSALIWRVGATSDEYSMVLVCLVVESDEYSMVLACLVAKSDEYSMVLVCLAATSDEYSMVLACLVAKSDEYIEWFWRAWSQKVMNIKWFWRAWLQKVMNIQWFCDGFALLPFGVPFLETPRRE